MKYMGVSLPIKLLNRIDKKREKYAYSSRADFVKEACRRELERLDRLAGEAIGDEK